ncbi:Hypothetical protein GSB_152174, partial [Giardia duodenalis]
VSTRPSWRSPCGGGHRARPALAEAPPKPAEAAIIADLLASRGRRRAGLLMPGFFHKEPRRVWPPSTSARGRGPGDLSVEGPLCRRADIPQPPPRAPAIRQGRRTVSRCAACDRQERAVKERHGSVLDHEARHDRPCLYPRLSGSSTRSWRSDAQPPPTRTRAGHLAHRQVQGHRRGRHPAPPDGPLLQREAQEAQGRDSRSSAERLSTQSRQYLGAPRGR